jgi:3-hydroxyacyl-CoA dehydrogenase
VSNLIDGPARLALHGDVAVITLHNPPVNALSTPVAEAIAEAIRSLSEEETVSAIVLIGSGGAFIAGADIRELADIVAGKRPPLDLLTPLQVIEDSPKPVIAAIYGMALGGGLEAALSCHYRLLSSEAQVGQPEVKLGLIPGAGGTQRLPRLVGIAKAAELCATGEAINAQEAFSIGLADRLTTGDLLTEAIAFAREMAGVPVRKTRNLNDRLAPLSSTVLTTLRDRLSQSKRGQKAPLIAIDAVGSAVGRSFDEGCQIEARLFRECLDSDQSKAMIRAFFGERTVARVPSIPKTIKPLEIRSAAVIGAGTMGGGIAMTFADAGIPVWIKETSREALDRGMAVIRKNYERTVAKGRLSSSAAEARLDSITPQLDYGGFERADVIVEAIWENLDAKKGVFAALDQVAHRNCILASNTSSLDIDEIASATSRPQMVGGLHFFSPANVMRLLEIVRGKETADEVIATAFALGKRLGKVAVLAKNAPGFIGNRAVRPYLREARFLAEEGATVEDINAALYEFGMTMGPLAVDDLIGIDISWGIEQEFLRHDKTGVRVPVALKELYELRRYGQKTGAGWSRYDEARRALPDPEVAALLERAAQKAGIARRIVTREEIMDRCLCGLINEAARILEEGIALRSVDVDVTFLNGYGFPIWRGGPMFYADTVGLDRILTKVEVFERQFGSDLWTPAALLRQLAGSGKTFSDWDRERESTVRA